MAAEHFVAYRVFSKNWHASLTVKNFPGVDIFVYDKNGDRFAKLQVKRLWAGETRRVRVMTDRKPDHVERLEIQLEEVVTCPWVIVDLEEQNPICYVFPRREFIEIVAREHREYEHRMREQRGEDYIDREVAIVFNELDLEEYREAWDNIWEVN